MRVTSGSPIALYFEQNFLNDYTDWFYLYRTDTGKKVLFSYTVQENELILLDYAYVIVQVVNTTLPVSANTTLGFVVVKDTTNILVPIAHSNISITTGSGLQHDKVFPNILLAPGQMLEVWGFSDQKGVTVYHGAGIHFRRYRWVR